MKMKRRNQAGDIGAAITRWVKKTKLRLLCLLTVALALASNNVLGGGFNGEKRMVAQEPARFAIVSDPHLYDQHLGTSGAAFEAYLAQDPKLLRESEAILDAAISDILEQNVQFVIIPGDLTKDGELRDHVLMAQHLAKLEQQGVQVFVVPGNHDINNSDAVRFVGDSTRPVPGITPQTFRAIYERFGYGRALDRDLNSLSYVAEPAPGLWLLAIDSCKYDESKTNAHPVVSGRIRPETMAWIQAVMLKAHANGKQVIAFMHHGVNQHFFGESQFFPDYLSDDWVATSVQLAQTGLKVIFTGHYHSTDATYLVDQNLNPLSPLCDVETASLAAYPCAYRVASLDAGNQLHIETHRITEINLDTGGLPFQDYALNAVFAPTANIVTQRIQAIFGVSYSEAAAFAPIVTEGIVANYAGDEDPTPETQTLIGQFIGSPDPLHTLGLLLFGLWTDLPPGPTDGQSDSTLVLPIN
jgi:3',5'-cyclic AMP phosphodiesterase CpdA